MRLKKRTTGQTGGGATWRATAARTGAYSARKAAITRLRGASRQRHAPDGTRAFQGGFSKGFQPGSSQVVYQG